MHCLTHVSSQHALDKPRGWLVAVLGVCAALACCETGVRANSNATLGANASQTIKGWGMYPSDGLSTQPSSIQAAVYATGVNFARFRIPPGAGNSDGTINTSVLAPYVSDMQTAYNHGITNYFISSWSPPAYMKLPYQITLGQQNGVVEYLNPAYESQYVSFTVNVLAYYGKFVPLPRALSFQQEPNVAPPAWDGCNYTNHASLYQQIVQDLRTALDAAGMSSVRLIGPECQRLYTTTNILDPYFAVLNTNAALNAALDGYACHTYVTSGWQDYLNGILAHPKDCWMTEYSVSGSSDTIGTAITVFRRLMSDVIDVPNNYWFWWRGWRNVSAWDGEELVWTANGSTFTTNRLYYVFSKLWNSAPAPCQVYKLTTDDPDLHTSAGSQGPWEDMVAFRNANLNQLAILIANPTASSKVFNLHQCNVGNQADYYQTDTTHNMVWQGTLTIIGGNVTNVAIASNSITLVVCSAGPVTNPPPPANQIGYLDGPSPIYYGTNLNTTPFTVSSGASVLVVMIGTRNQGNSTNPGNPTNVTWNGNSLTLAVAANTGINTYDYNLIYYLTNPPAGSGAVTATLGTGVSQTWWKAYTLTNVSTTNAPLTGIASTTSGTIISNTISGVPAGAWAVVNSSTSSSGSTTLTITAPSGGTVLTDMDHSDGNGTMTMGSVANLPAGTNQFVSTNVNGSGSKMALCEAIFASSPPPASSPSSPVIQSPALMGTNFTLQVSSQSGFNYVLQATTNLAPADWIGIQTNPGGGMLTFTNAIDSTNRQQFFRIQAQ